MYTAPCASLIFIWSHKNLGEVVAQRNKKAHSLFLIFIENPEISYPFMIKFEWLDSYFKNATYICKEQPHAGWKFEAEKKVEFGSEDLKS